MFKVEFTKTLQAEIKFFISNLPSSSSIIFPTLCRVQIVFVPRVSNRFKQFVSSSGKFKTLSTFTSSAKKSEWNEFEALADNNNKFVSCSFLTEDQKRFTKTTKTVTVEPP